MKRQLWIVALGLAVAALLVACGDDDADDGGAVAASGDFGSLGAQATSSGTDASGGGASVPGANPAPRAEDSAEPPASGQDSLSLQIATASRQIIYTSSMVVTVDDVLLATQQAQSEIAALGGLVFGQDTSTDPRPRTVLTFKVRPEDFDEALSRLADLGELESQRTSADDVTDRVVDLESQIITSEASVERLRTFLENATDLETVASLERELLSRETNLELLRGQLRTIQDQVALATIFLTLTEPEPPSPEAHVELVETAYLGTDAGARCPGDDELTVDEGESITVCIVVENVGTLPLTEIEIRDVRLDLDEDDFVLIEGSLDRLEPESRLVGHWDTTAEPGAGALPSFSAVPVDEDGDPVRIAIDVDAEAVDLEVLEDTSIPGFTDGFSASWDGLLNVGRVAILAAGLLLPFIWVPVLVGGIVFYGGRFASRRQRPAAVIPPPRPTSEPEDTPEA